LLLAPGGSPDLSLLAAGRGAHHSLARDRVGLLGAPAHRRRDPVGGHHMIRLWLLLHLLGFTMWLGGGLAAMAAGIAGKREDRAGPGAAYVDELRQRQKIVASASGTLALVALVAGAMVR